MKFVFFLAFLLTSSTRVFGQFIVRGTIIDKKSGDSIPGASIAEKGTKSGTMSDLNGAFTITVSEPADTLIILLIGYQKQEIPIGGRAFIQVSFKEECMVDFFDQNLIELSVRSGVLKTPIGGQFSMSTFVSNQSALKGTFSYQTDLEDNNFTNAGLTFMHLAATCDFDTDINFGHRRISWQDKFDFKSFMLEGRLNFSESKIFHRYTILFVGYGRSDFLFTEGPGFKNTSGFLAGLGTYTGGRFNLLLTAKAIYWTHYWEYQAMIKRQFRWLSLSAEFVNIENFTELSLGAGWRFYH